MIGVTKYVDFVVFGLCGLEAVDRFGHEDEVINIWRNEYNALRIINKRWVIDH